jgi:hypothetical protein
VTNWPHHNTNSHLAVTLQYSDDASPLNVMFEWKPCADGTSPMARRLAAIYFSKSADFIAACYSSFNQAANLEAITVNLDAELLDDVGVPEELTRFRALPDNAHSIFDVIQTA